jgi:hypothetical protein
MMKSFSTTIFTRVVGWGPIFLFGGRWGGAGGYFLKMFPRHSHEVPQDFPSSTALLSHMFWSKFNFHIYICIYTLKGARETLWHPQKVQ